MIARSVTGIDKTLRVSENGARMLHRICYNYGKSCERHPCERAKTGRGVENCPVRNGGAR